MEEINYRYWVIERERKWVNASSACVPGLTWIKKTIKWVDVVAVVVAATDSDNENYDCFVVFILSHGSGSGKVYGTDGDISISKLMEPLKKNRLLDGKPKMVFVQVCYII